MNELIGRATETLDMFSDLCGSADTARRIILIVTIIFILKEAREYFRTYGKGRIFLIIAAELIGCSINCYYKPSKWPLMIPIVILAAIMAWLAITGRDRMRVNIPVPGRTSRKGGRKA